MSHSEIRSGRRKKKKIPHGIISYTFKILQPKMLQTNMLVKNDNLILNCCSNFHTSVLYSWHLLNLAKYHLYGLNTFSAQHQKHMAITCQCRLKKIKGGLNKVCTVNRVLLYLRLSIGRGKASLLKSIVGFVGRAYTSTTSLYCAVEEQCDINLKFKAIHVWYFSKRFLMQFFLYTEKPHLVRGHWPLRHDLTLVHTAFTRLAHYESWCTYLNTWTSLSQFHTKC